MDNVTGLCPVCAEKAEIVGHGKCNHPVCLQCCTRMRVLNGNSECPICRCELLEIIFVESGGNIDFSSLNLEDYIQNCRYKVRFESHSIKNAFYALINVRCPICPITMPEFAALKHHMRKEHNRLYCDLCVKNLMLFPWEYKTYTRSDLAAHRRKGDTNDKSYRGHPICQFCNWRYFDTDDLYRHLRRDHFHCHFCDTEILDDITECEKDVYYDEYADLKQHFMQRHYLCDIGKCGDSSCRFTNVFRNELDFKAHQMNVHGRQAKADRKIDGLEFNLVPREEAQRTTDVAENRSEYSTSRQRYSESDQKSNKRTSTTQSKQNTTCSDPPSNCKVYPARRTGPRMRTGSWNTHAQLEVLGQEDGAVDSPADETEEDAVDNNSSSELEKEHIATDEENFPSLSGKLEKPVLQPTAWVSGTSGSGRLDEDFPVLGATVSSVDKSPTGEVPSSVVPQEAEDFPTLSSILSSNKPKPMATIAEDLHTHQQVASAKQQVPDSPRKVSQNKPEFKSSTVWGVTPTLQHSSNGALSSDFPPLCVKPKKNSFWTNDVVKGKPVVKPVTKTTSASLTTVKSETSGKEYKIVTEDFPALPVPTHRKVQVAFPSKKMSAEKTSEHEILVSAVDGWSQDSFIKSANTKYSSYSGIRVPTNYCDLPMTIDDDLSEKPHKPEQIVPSIGCSKDFPGLQANHDESKPVNGHVSLPTPLSRKQAESNRKRMVAKNSDEERSRKSTDISANISSKTTYIVPDDFAARNSRLLQLLREILAEKFVEFSTLSKQFRNEQCSTQDYVIGISELIEEDRFSDFLPELILLLPNIKKQNDIVSAFGKRKRLRFGLNELKSCMYCKQLLRASDLSNHLSVHTSSNLWTGS